MTKQYALTDNNVDELLILLNREIDNLEFNVDYFKDDPLMDFDPMKRRIKRLKQVRTKLTIESS